MRERESDLEALHEIAVASSGELDPERLGLLVIERARSLTGADEATLLWWDPEANALRVLGDTYSRPFPRMLRSGEGFAGMIYRDGIPMVLEDYPGWEHSLPDAVKRGMRSVAGVPMIVGSKPVGALTVSYNRSHEMKAEELQLLALIANQVAPALEAARLHGEMVRVGRELEHANVELVEANRHKSAFLASMSHELRTPLNAIIGFSELLADASEGQFDEATTSRFLNQIVTSGRHLLSLINDILDLSKVEAGQMQLALERVSMADAVEQVTRGVEPLVARKRIELAAQVDPQLVLTADAQKLRQMLLNVVSNAIKFTPEAGRVTITAGRSGDSAEVAVADTGIGIAESDLSRIFEEFRQAGDASGRKQEGRVSASR